MENVYIKVQDMNEWIAKYFPNQDLVTIEEVLAVIEELDSKLSDLQSEYEEYQQNVADNYEQVLFQKQIQ